ncbi:extracellular solute-binding protein [Marinomonas sp. S3726]|uniref:extracellular solute-binding protein n=1 Tax=Marinomonas sp. S3726 TaxID=579484 RepID=UPI000A02F2A9|nr:extracellular solute-binding protein [Marinomonas sp. S3726]
MITRNLVSIAGTILNKTLFNRYLFNICLAYCAVFYSSAQAEGHGLHPFKLTDIPDISNKKSITLVAEDGFWTEHLKNELLPKFTKHTGVSVRLIPMSLGDMYETQTKSLMHGKGKYDLLTMEAGWSKEWATRGLTTPLHRLASKYDNSGLHGIDEHLSSFYPNLLQILSYKGQSHSIPYNNYTMGNHYRQDLFEHPAERAEFQKSYGYALSPPKSLNNLIDVARFFTRYKGEFLAGKILQHDFYGLTLMSGNKPHINDEFSSLLWGLGGSWLTPEYNDMGDIDHFIVKANSQTAIEAAKAYLNLLDFAAPADESSAYLESAQALANDRVAMWPFAYNNLWSISAQVEENIPGAKIGISSSPLGKPYTGAYALAVAYDSQNPEAAYWLLKYITSFEGQLAYAKGGGNPCRLDVALLDDFNSAEMYPISGSFRQNHKDNLAWSDQVLSLGHFTSTAMGKIYPELMRTAYLIRSKQLTPKNALNQLQAKIYELQNLHGEIAAFNQVRIGDD